MKAGNGRVKSGASRTGVVKAGSSKAEGWQRRLVINLSLVLAGAIIYSLGFPNFIVDWGMAPFAWVALVPLVVLVRRIHWWQSPLWGALYGYCTYSILNFWLASFNPVSFLVVPVIYAVYFMFFVPALFLADRAFGHRAWLAQLCVWMLYEVFRLQGFLGYAYGIIGYSQYAWRSLIGIADVFGVMGVSVLVAGASFITGGYLLDYGYFPGAVSRGLPNPPARGGRWLRTGGLWLFLVLAANLYGLFSRVDYSGAPTWRVALIQHNANTWLKGEKAWNEALDRLIAESRMALGEKPEVVVWPETAFVPSIEWHRRYRKERAKVKMVKTLEDFLSDVNVPVILGNNDSERDGSRRVDYNAVFLLDGSRIVDRYRKIHLVPFSEYFPYGRFFPWLLNYIQEQGTPFYQSGTRYTVFNLEDSGGPKAAPLICFEDTFGYLARRFVQEGGEVLVNLTNDSWSPEPASAIQHFNMAVFRAVENRRSMVRATTAGITAVVDPNGRPLKLLEPFTQGYLVGDVPVYTDRETIYTRYGNWFQGLCVVAGLLALLWAAAVLIWRRPRRQGEGENGD